MGSGIITSTTPPSKLQFDENHPLLIEIAPGIGISLPSIDRAQAKPDHLNPRGNGLTIIIS